MFSIEYSKIKRKLKLLIPESIYSTFKIGFSIYLKPIENSIPIIEQYRLFRPFKNLIICFKKNYYRGKNFFCPICGNYLRNFLPMGKRVAARCPYCGSLERHRLIFLYLLRKTKFFREKMKILHIGPNKGFMKTLQRITNINYVSIDYYLPYVMHKMNLIDLSFNDNSFDICLCIHVLEHIEDDLKALKEILRTLKPNGWAIIDTPIDYSLEHTLEIHEDIEMNHNSTNLKHTLHHKHYGKDFINRLQSVGFKVKIVDYTNNLMLKKIKPPKDKRIYVCYKPKIEKNENF